jgi:hypothetical protein
MSDETPASPPARESPPADGRNRDGTFTPGNLVGASTRFQPGNLSAVRSGERSWLIRHALAPGQEGLRDALASDRAAIVGDLGEDVSTVTGRLIDSLLETIALKTWAVERIAEVGPWGPSGRLRPVVGVFLKAVETQRQLSVTIGLARRAKPVHPLEAVRRAVEEANAR